MFFYLNYYIYYIFMVLSSLVNNMIFMWVSMELMNFLFLFFMSYYNKVNSNNNMIYFIIQESSSLILMFLFLMNSYYMFILILLLKLSVTPFHNWMIKLNKLNSWSIIFILLTFQKIIPILMFSFIFLDNMMWLFIMNSVYSVYLMFMISSNKEMISLSSMNSMTWILLLCMMDKNFVICYFFFYFFIFFFLIYIFKYFNNLNMYLKSNMNLYVFLLLLNLMSFPPSIMFFLKMKIFFLFMSCMIPMLFLIIIILSSLFMGLMYFKYLINMFMSKFWEKKKSLMNLNVMIQMWISFIFFLL